MTETRAEVTHSENPAATQATEGVQKAPVKWEKPTMRTKLAYTIPSFASYAMAAPTSVELKIFYTDKLLVPAGLLALVSAIAQAFVALTDPVIAYLTDNTRTRWGRRKIYIPIGVPLCALCYWAMFAPPRSLSSPLSIAVWAGLAFGLYFFFYGVCAIPYGALGLELTPDYDDRTSIFGIRSILGGVGVILSYGTLFWFNSHIQWFGDQRQMLYVMTGFLAILMVLFFIFPMIGVKENPDFV